VTRASARQSQRVVATELSEEAVHAAAESLADIDNVEVHLSNLFANTGEQPPFSGQHFNLVLLSEVLEHLEDDIGASRRIRQLLEDVGVLVITVPRLPATDSEQLQAAIYRRGRNEYVFLLWEGPVFTRP
jgi:2-polyprenyl-3-methyl-5-hydroxy-6-metoxy-1,4-benzoquinol methylase